MAGSGVMATDGGLMGGYPASAGYRFQANKTNIKERIEKGLPIPLGGDVDPDHPTYERIWRRKSFTVTVKRCQHKKNLVIMM